MATTPTGVSQLELTTLHDEARVAHDLMRDGYSALAVREANS